MTRSPGRPIFSHARRVELAVAAAAVFAIVLLASFEPLAAQVSVTPDGAALTAAANTGGQSAQFTVRNLGTSSQTYYLFCYPSGAVTSCSPNQSTLGQIPPGINIPAPATFATGAVGSGTIQLKACDNSICSQGFDYGSYNVTVLPPYGVAVTPDGGTAATRVANTGGYSEQFTVTNTGTQPNTFTFACTGTGGVTCGTVPASVSPAPNGGWVTVNMPYSVGAAGTGTLTLTATGTSASDAGSYSVPIVRYGVSVATAGGVTITATRFSNTGGYSESFLVTNTGSTSNTFSFTCTAAGPVICGTPPTAATLASGGVANVSMPYSVGAAAAGTLTLTATGTNASNAASYSVPVAVNLSKVTNGVFTKDNNFLLQETANTYDATGRIIQLADARGYLTDYQYGGNSQNAFLIQVKRWKTGVGGEYLATDIAYLNGNVSSIRNEGGTSRFFTYDTYGRLRQIKNNSVTVVKAYGYTYSRTSANGWVFQASSPNAVVDTTFLQQAPLKAVVSTGYVDGLGRAIQTVVQDGTNYVVTATQYDLMGRTWRTRKPYTRGTPGYDASFATNATSFYNAYHGTSTAQPYVETQYRADALGRVSKVIPEYIGTAPTAFTLTSYGIDPGPTVKQQIVEVTDEAGKKKRSYADLFGNNVKTILGYGAPEVTTTLVTYNVLGQRTQATDPRGLNTTYARDTRGLLRSRTSPDAGTVNYKYDKAGNLRFSQDANQAAAGQVYFTNYDFAGRALVSGQAAATFSSLNPDASQAFESDTSTWLVVRAYDAKPSPSAPTWDRFSAQITPLTLANVSGRLAAVGSKSNGARQITLFSYDADGRVTTRYTYTQPNGGGSVLTALNTTVAYARDLRDAITQRSLTVGTSTFYQWYDYDNRGLLWKAFDSTLATKPATPGVTDTYRPSGQPQDYQFKGGPLVPIRYTIRGQTEKVGDPTLASCATCPFNARYAYLPNGVVDTAEFYNAGSPAAQKRYRYAFGPAAYDALNRLKSADFSSWSGSAWTSTLAYDLAGINYDAAGNITALRRYRETATLIDNLTYAYPSTSNRLSSVTDAVGATAETWDAEPGSFTYDPNGNVATAPAPYSITAVTYNHQNLPLSLTRSGPTTTVYRYDNNGQRITKQVNGGNTEVYVQEGATTLGVFTVNATGTPTSWYFNVLAENQPVGRQPSSGNRRYYHSDLLGSTRSVVDGATAAVVEAYDYDPWGLLMPGRTLGSGTKEGFTGKEQDGETGLHYFGARYYMAALARWTSVDPMADNDPEWSPYNYVLNNPLSSVDPTGLECDPIQGGIRCTDVKPQDIKEISTFVGQDLGQFNGDQTGVSQGGCKAPGNCTQSDVSSKDIPKQSPRACIDLFMCNSAAGAGKYLKELADVVCLVTCDIVPMPIGMVGPRVPLIGGRAPINSRYAGLVHPSGVRFTRSGFPDFSPYAKARVVLDGLTGNYSLDAALANRAAGLDRTPAGMVWHHVEDGTTMLLVPREIHSAVPHTGGAAVIRQNAERP